MGGKEEGKETGGREGGGGEGHGERPEIHLPWCPNLATSSCSEGVPEGLGRGCLTKMPRLRVVCCLGLRKANCWKGTPVPGLLWALSHMTAQSSQRQIGFTGNCLGSVSLLCAA